MSEIRTNTRTGLEVAVIGMSCRFPGARNLREFWRLLKGGAETISFFSDEELTAVIKRDLLRDPRYIKAKGFLEDIEYFDPVFFGYTPQAAEMLSPQVRLFHECAWEALEDAGYDPFNYRGDIGVYAGASPDLYWEMLSYGSAKCDLLGDFATGLLNNKDMLCTRLSYQLNLSGPSVTVHTACSTSLVAIHLACRALVTGECAMALAGGVSISLPKKKGYLYEEGMLHSPDGHCRAFDAQANGTVFGDGAGIVLLKRLEDALLDGDHIYAVIKGSAINNDGHLKVGFTAPSTKGQRNVIKAAYRAAQVDPATIGYVETHGTGTSLGDPIEIEALKQAFARPESPVCKIGSVKTNVGHLDSAAGVAGFIKTVLSLRHRQLPPSLHFRVANPRIDFEGSPFEVNTKLVPWEANGHPLRAGVSSFGVGGTNAHVVLEESPVLEPSGGSREVQMVMLSGRTAGVLERQTAQLVEYFARGEEMNLADVAYTLQVGRRGMSHRRVVWCRNRAEAMAGLLGEEGVASESREVGESRPQVVYMFTGQGSQYVEMGRGLYEQEEVYRRVAGECFERMREYTDLDLSGILYSGRGGGGRQIGIDETEASQPLLFVIEYGIAKQLEHWGIRPDAMIGHSIGEYVAATISGVLRLEDALRLVVLRGRLMQGCRRGVMLSVGQSGEVIKELLGEGLWLAAENSSELSVISGEEKAIGRLEEELSRRGLWSRRLRTSHAFHSGLMDEMLSSYREGLKGIQFGEPAVRYISNVTGDWVSRELVSKGDYWVRHVREGVRFSVGMSELLRGEGERILMEIGPGQSLSALVRQHAEYGSRHGVERVLRGDQESVSDWHYLLRSVGRLWLRGLEIDWGGYYSSERRRRVSLPTYPFERKRYWIDGNPFAVIEEVRAKNSATEKKGDVGEWFYVPCWKQSILTKSKDHRSQKYLVFINETGFGIELIRYMQKSAFEFVIVKSGNNFNQLDHNIFEINPRNGEDYNLLLSRLIGEHKLPDVVIHSWLVDEPDNPSRDLKNIGTILESGFYSLIHFARATANQKIEKKIRLYIVSNNLQKVLGDEPLCPEKATVLGPIKVIPQEMPWLQCSSIDLNLADLKDARLPILIGSLFEESQFSTDTIIAYRGNRRWVQTFEQKLLNPVPETPSVLRKQGVYLITGGLGRVALALSEHLARRIQPRLILVGRSDFPDKTSWRAWLHSHDNNDPVSRKISQLQKIEQLGAIVSLVAADVADEESMNRLIAEAENLFGGINGVIHAAGDTMEDHLLPAERIISSSCECQFRPKLHGLIVLEKLLRHKNLDFFITTSSISCILGGLGFTAYVAANTFMDAFVQKQNQISSFRWMSINWDAWQFDESSDQTTQFGKSVIKMAMTPAEGYETFSRILSWLETEQVVVSTGDLFRRMRQWLRNEEDSEQNKVVRNLISVLDTNGSGRSLKSKNQLEVLLSEIWQEHLGIECIGKNDNFFELGATSLDLVQVNKKLKQQIGRDISVVTMFQYPMIGALAKYLIDGTNDHHSEIDGLKQRNLTKGKESIQKRLQIRKGR